MKKTLGTALITGGSKRIGQAICLKLSQLGFSIALHYQHSKVDAKKTAQLIKDQDGQCKIFSANLLNEKQVSSLIYKVNQTFPNLNLLINNASIFEKSNLKTATVDSFNKHFAIHLKAPFILTQSFAKICKKGQIINILDTNIVRNGSENFTYLLSKKALADFTKMAALELAPDIRVNAIAPGFILPPTDQTKINLKQRIAKIPLRQQGNIEQIAQTIEFLIKNFYLTGQIIFNDGGEHLI